jgi:hypothetical protein
LSEQAVTGYIYWTALVVSFLIFQKVALLATSDKKYEHESYSFGSVILKYP